VEFIKKHHDRITHVHIKDRKMQNGPNVPFGQGDTPIKDVLLLMKKEKYPFQATIEFEYPVPPGSDVLTEISKSVEYCKNILA
jgi:sugar phosphate isomerase/epimerase